MTDYIFAQTKELSLRFSIENGKIGLSQMNGVCLQYERKKGVEHGYVARFDADKKGDDGDRNFGFGEEVFYENYSMQEKDSVVLLTIAEKNDTLRVETKYELFGDSGVIGVSRRVTNLSDAPIYLEQCSSFMAYGLFAGVQGVKLYRAYNSNYNECQWTAVDLYDEGVFSLVEAKTGHRRAFACNNGSQSSKNFLPMGMLYDGKEFVAWQIASDSVWHYEVGLYSSALYLNLSGGAYSTTGYIRCLEAGASFETVGVQLAFGKDIDEVTARFTDYRRSIRKGRNKYVDAVIFNEFMHCSWDSPNERRTLEVAKQAAEYGADYYIIDACWHDEECDTSPTHTIGNWRESKTRYPSGLKNTLDQIRSFGLKTGLWIEIQSVGMKCPQPPLSEDCYFQFKGKRTVKNYRYHLDFRNPKTREWATSTVDRVIREYQIDYLKIDYNQSSYGTDYRSTSMAEALEDHSKAYIAWLDELTKRYPRVIFEGCASGGQSVNPLQLGVCDLMSTSDTEKHTAYAYISANIGSAIVPEQAAVWCYPLDYWKSDATTTEEDVVLNMVNPLFHRIHLASRFGALSSNKTALIKEGLAYYRKLSTVRDRAYPIFPCGFADRRESVVVGGLRCGKRLFVSVYKLEEGAREVVIDLSKYGRGKAKIGYPLQAEDELQSENGKIKIRFPIGASARVIEYELE